jgi:hypothetical protein
MPYASLRYWTDEKLAKENLFAMDIIKACVSIVSLQAVTEKSREVRTEKAKADQDG